MKMSTDTPYRKALLTSTVAATFAGVLALSGAGFAQTAEECALKVQDVQGQLEQQPEDAALQGEVDKAAALCGEGRIDEADQILMEVVERMADTVTQ